MTEPTQSFHHYDYRGASVMMTTTDLDTADEWELRMTEINAIIDETMRKPLVAHHAVGDNYRIDFTKLMPESSWKKGNQK